jgi:hypothetical protein
MSKKFPQDEFDLAPLRAGRHRRARTALDRTREFVSVVASGALLAGAGFVALNLNNPTGSNLNNTNSNLPAANPQSVASKGGGIGLSVLDGSLKADQASTVAHELLDSGWNVFSAADLVDATYQLVGVAKTTIYIQSADLQNKADSLVKDLGSYPIKVSTDYTDPITVVLGADYKK